MYQHYRVVRMQAKAERFLGELFHAYEERPEMLPSEVQDRGLRIPWPRVVCDYIAGMTDRFALDEHSKLFDPKVLP
jgi:dGTPase